MILKKRNCRINMSLIPYGAGWTNLSLDMDGEKLNFILSNVMNSEFEDLMRVLYHLHPNNGDYEYAEHLIEYKVGLCEATANGYRVTKVVDSLSDGPGCGVYQNIPWKGEFTWDEEGAYSHWTIEREPSEKEDFQIKITIEICRENKSKHTFVAEYKDFCYAVADAYTKMLKRYGFWGYHYSTYCSDIHLRYFLFLKSVALNCFDARQLMHYNDEEQGSASNLEKELELLLFDM